MGGGAPGATLMVHLLGRCNLECRHCYMGGAPDRRERLPNAWVLDAIRSAPSLGIGQLYLTGGEPLLYPGFADLLETAATVEQLAITVCTNGTIVDDGVAAALAAAGCEANISIDGQEAFHDAFRQRRGAFRRSERGIRALRAAGVPVTIVHTVLQDNLRHLDGVASWALDMGAARLLVQPLLRLGRGSEIADRRLTIEQANSLVLELSDLANRHRGKMKCTLLSPSLHNLRAHPCGAYVCNGVECHRGVQQEVKKIVVREDGWILPEVTNLDHRYAIGHVDDGPLESLIEPYFADGYDDFDALCRAAFTEVLPSWPSVLVPWDEIVAERSASMSRVPRAEESTLTCGSCSSQDPHADDVPLVLHRALREVEPVPWSRGVEEGRR